MGGDCDYILILIIIIKRISRTPLYRTRWEHRALYNNTNKIHTHTHTHTHTHSFTSELYAILMALKYIYNIQLAILLFFLSVLNQNQFYMH